MLKIISAIRKEGDFLYNSKQEFNKGDLIVVRRPKNIKSPYASDFRTCGNCGGMYSVWSLSVPFISCKNDQKVTTHRKDVLSESRLKSFVIPKANFIMQKKILLKMRGDVVNNIVRSQKVIILFGNRLTQKYRSPHFYKMIRSRLRAVAKIFVFFSSADEDQMCMI